MRKITLLLSVLVLSVLAFAQQTITGTVRDENGDPIPFATVTEVGKNNVVKANENGVFTIKVPEGTKLRITASGHQEQVVTVSGTTVTATLTSTQQQLSEVVVTTALGIRRQSKELGYAATTINAKTITQGRAVNVQQALNGKISGVSVTTTNSSVFENAKINIRGIRSLTGNNQPLLIVDGAPVSLNFLSSIPPGDIQD